MLNDYQIMVVRRAIALATDREKEISRLAKGMGVKESEIRVIADEVPLLSKRKPGCKQKKSTPAISEVPKPAAQRSTPPAAEQSPSTKSINLVSELIQFIQSLEPSFSPVEMGSMQANQSAGWASCNFTASGGKYSISLKRRE